MSACGGLTRAAADIQIVGGATFPTREHRCIVCADTGVILGDHDEVLDLCDCETGEAQR